MHRYTSRVQAKKDFVHNIKRKKNVSPIQKYRQKLAKMQRDKKNRLGKWQYMDNKDIMKNIKDQETDDLNRKVFEKLLEKRVVARRRVVQ